MVSKAMRWVRTNILSQAKSYYLELTATSLMCYNAKIAQSSALWAISLPAGLCLTTKLGNIQALTETLQACVKKSAFKSNDAIIICAPHLAACTHAEQPFALMQLLVVITKAGINPTKIIDTSCIDAQSQLFKSTSYRTSKNLLDTFNQYNNHYILYLAGILIIASLSALYYMINITNNLNHTIKSYSDTLATQTNNRNPKQPKQKNALFYDTFINEQSLNVSSLLTTLAECIPNDCILTYTQTTCMHKVFHTGQSKPSMTIHGNTASTESLSLFIKQLNAHPLNQFTFTINSCIHNTSIALPFSYVFILDGIKK